MFSWFYGKPKISNPPVEQVNPEEVMEPQFNQYPILEEIQPQEENKDQIISTLTNIQTSDNTELLLLQESIDQLPPCAEKYLKELIIMAQNTEGTDITEATKETFLKIYSKLENHLKQESQIQNINTALQDGQLCCQLKDIKGLLTYLKIIKKQTMSLDIPLMMGMFKKGNDAAKEIEGKDIFILLGGSGAGKSTTIHFLAGSKMIETKVGGITHIGPSIVNNPQAEGIMTGPFAFSVTKFIKCVKVDNLIICDSPGFEDTQGPEVDIANSVGVVKGIQRSKTVRIGIVVSFKTTGERYKGMKSLAKLVASMFTNLNNYIGTFIYIFTKFPVQEQQQVSEHLQSVLDSLTEEEKLDEQFVMLLKDLLKKAKQNNILFINPLQDDRKFILDEIKECREIKNPNDAIKQYISQQSADALRNQCNLHYKQIVYAVEQQRNEVVKRDDLGFIEFITKLLDELAFLQNNLDKPYIYKAYDDSIKCVSNFFNERSRQLKSALEKCFDLNNMLNLQDLEQFKQGLLTFKLYDIFKNKYLDPETEDTIKLMKFLKNQVNTLMENSKQLNYSDEKMLIILNKLKLISQEFIYLQSDYNDINRFVIDYNDVIKNVNGLIQKDIQSIKQFYTEFEFEKTASTFFLIKACLNDLKEHLKDSIDVDLKNLIQNFKNFLESYADEVINFLIIDNEDDQIAFIFKIAEIIKNIECFREEFTNYKNQDILNVVTVALQRSCNNVLEFIQKTIKDIEDASNDDDYFVNIQKSVLTVKNLRDNILIVKNQSADIFYQMSERIFAQVYLAIKETKEILENLLSAGIFTDEIINSLKLKLKILLQSSWLDKLDQEFSTQTCLEFFQQIQNCCKKIESKSNRIQITIRDYDNLYQIFTMIQQAQRLKDFDEINPNAQLKVATIVDSIESRFNEQIQEVNNQIYQVIEELEQINIKLDQVTIINTEQEEEQINTIIEESRLDNQSIKKIEETLIFLEEIVKVESQLEYVTLRIEHFIAQHGELISKIQNYKDKFPTYVQNTLSSITSYKGVNKKQLKDDSNDLIQQLINIKNVKEKTEYFDQYLETDSLIKISSDQLSYQAEELREQLGRKVAVKQSIEIDLEIVKSLKKLDQFNQGEKYIDIYKDYSVKNFQILETNQADLYKKIREHDFGSIENDLHKLKQQQGGEEQLAQLCQAIKRELKNIIDTARILSYQTENKDGMTIERLEQIMKSVSKIEDCKKLEIFLEYKDSDVQNIIKIVSDNYMKRLEKIENQTKQHNFFQANQELDAIKFVQTSLHQHCPKEILDKTDGINEIRKQYLEKIFEEYNQLDITDYGLKMPKVIIDKLLQANLESHKVRLVEIISQKFSERIATIKNEKIRKIDMLKKLKYIVPSLGDALATQITAMIQNALDEIEYEQECRKREINAAQEGQDKVQLISLLKESITKNHHQEEEQIKNIITAIVEKHYQIINSKINSLDPQVKQALEEIAEIKNNLEKFNLSIKFHRINEIQHKFKSLCNDALKQTQLYFKKNEYDERNSDEFRFSGILKKSQQFFIKEENDEDLDEIKNRSIQLSEYLIQSDDEDSASSTTSQNFVSHLHLIKLISLRISQKNIIQAFIVDFDKKVCKEVQKLIETMQNNQQVITECLNDKKPDLKEMQKNLKYVKQKSNFFKQIKEKVQSLQKTIEEEIFEQEIKLKDLESTIYMQEPILQVIEDIGMAEQVQKQKIQAQELKKMKYLMATEKELLENMQQRIQLVQELLGKSDKILFFTQLLYEIDQQMIPKTSEILNLCKKLINDQTMHQSAQRYDFYKKLNKDLLYLQNLKLVFDQLVVGKNNYAKIFEKCKQHIEDNIRVIQKTALNQIEEIKINLKINDDDKQQNLKIYEDLSIQYCNLIDIAQFVEQEFQSVQQHIDDIKDKIKKKINFSSENGTKAVENGKVIEIAANIILLTLISKIHIDFKNITEQKVNEIIGTVTCHKNKNKIIAQLQEILHQNPIGKEVIEMHQTFKSFSVSIFNQKTQTQDIVYVMNKIEGYQDYQNLLVSQNGQKSNIDQSYLIAKYQAFKAEYQKLVDQSIYKNIEEELNKYKSHIKKEYFLKSTQDELQQWAGIFKEDIPTLMAHIFAMWTLMNCEYYQQISGSQDEQSQDSAVNKESAQSYLFQPHPAQVIGIFRILGLGNFKQTGFINNLVQIGTGEGKSVTIAVTAIILAILGFDVSCACYSEYLSKRDQAAFHSLFEILEVGNFVNYGTFDQLCEKVINKRVDIRSAVTNLFVNNTATNEIFNSSTKPQALIIDEVDVFFSKNYYGMQYCPVANIRDQTINQIVKFIWENRANKLTLKTIMQSIQYINLKNKFPSWESVIKEQILEMLDAVKNFEGQDYHLDELKGKIGYKDNDKISYDIMFGYKTTFLYFAELLKGRIKQQHLDANISLNLNCGNFSYAEMPRFFDFVMGATGTLRTLCEEQQKIIKEEYKINQITFLPSVFGDNQLNFDKLNDVIITKKDNYYQEICKQAEIQLKVNRPVLIFFEDAQKLQQFFQSTEFSYLKSYKPNYLTEAANSDEKDKIIKRATSICSLNLFTKSYGRGTDFITRDDKVQAAGGSFIIQTFFSDEISEEIQIKGRTARQGERGSYIMVLLQDDLEKVKVTDIQIENTGRKQMYNFMDEVRTQNFSNFFKAHTENATIARKVHEKSLQFQDKFIKSDQNGIREFILKYNKGKEEETSSRIVILMDATGSMGNVIERTKQTVVQMFMQAQEILQVNKISDDCFSVQFAAFRNYESTEANLLQVSPWTTKPQELKIFLNGVKAQDGICEEAVEVGLWHALQEHKKEPISSIILIGDAPPNPKSTWDNYINKIAPKFRTVRHFEDEVADIMKENIPVNAFYVSSDWPKPDFERISNLTKGQSKFLDIDAKNGAEELMTSVTEFILDAIDRSKGTKSNLREQYVTRRLQA